VKKTAEVKLKGPKGQSMVNSFVIRMHSVTTSRTKFNSGGNGTPNREITYNTMISTTSIAIEVCSNT
jgi:hypothetical protein